MSHASERQSDPHLVERSVHYVLIVFRRVLGLSSPASGWRMLRHPLEVKMPIQAVNLDAMIQREDFEESSASISARTPIREIRVSDLEESQSVFRTLRKPDFQRVTANWSADKIADFVQSFLNEEFVPALIMWESKATGKLFVIDGAHRLSALIGWVNNDYGNGKLSKAFFGEDGISTTQERYAKTTTDLIEKIGTYADLKYYSQNPEKAPNEKIRVLARKLFTSKLDLQWTGGDAKTAENSFFKINVSATIIDDTELSVLKARHKPNAIATRALIHAGRGHKFWMGFPSAAQTEIERLASDVHQTLFKPILEDPIKTVELPVAGHSYSPSSFQMLLDLVNMTNNITPAMWIESANKRKKSSDILVDDPDGTSTINFLKQVRRAAWLISGNQEGSLGLHPVVYFYGATGKFHPPALLSAIKFFTGLKDEGDLLDFTTHRYAFEEFLATHRRFINNLSHSKGSRTRPVEAFMTLYKTVLKGVKDRIVATEIEALLRVDPKLKGLEFEEADNDRKYRRRFDKDIRSASYLDQAINSPLRCAICKARMHSKSMNSDHIVRLEDGGVGNPENHQWTHFFCNGTVKN
jgi:hypothetical protein